ncbi:MAG: hypothetical protein AAGD25_32145 [Cyanobacteria bacterium P01_F01_bin.150]
MRVYPCPLVHLIKYRLAREQAPVPLALKPLAESIIVLGQYSRRHFYEDGDVFVGARESDRHIGFTKLLSRPLIHEWKEDLTFAADVNNTLIEKQHHSLWPKISATFFSPVRFPL